MLKSILDLGNVRPLSKKEQKNIKGGDSFLCAVICGPGSGNISIYDEDLILLPNGDLITIEEEVGCFCV
jgi:hypothetical protein